MRAHHGVKIKCKGSSRKRQFDGYREEIFEDLETVAKIALECKRWKSKIPTHVVEAFSRKIEGCNIKHGYIISFSGFQKGAKERARELDIGLFEFRPCIDGDFKKGTKIIDFDPIALSYWNARLGLSSSTPLDAEKELIFESLKSIHNVIIYDENGNEIGIVGRIVTDLLEREMIHFGRKKGKATIDWSTKKYQIRPSSLNRGIGVTTLEIVYQLPIKQIKPLTPSNWYIMKNAITNSRKLISQSKVKEIESKYR